MKAKKEIPDILAEFLGHPGKMISGSKGMYSHSNPDHIVVFNANLVLKSRGKIWYGDLDLTVSYDVLRKVREQIKEDIYVLYEMDARFDREEKPRFENFAALVKSDSIVCRRWNDAEVEFKDGQKPSAKLLAPNKTEAKELAKERKNADARRKEEFLAENPRDNFVEFSFPRVSKGTKSLDPISSLQKSLIKKYGKEKAQELWSSGYLSRADMKKITEALKKWLNKYKRIPMKSYTMKKNLAWVTFNLPLEFLHDLSWTKAGKIYLRK